MYELRTHTVTCLVAFVLLAACGGGSGAPDGGAGADVVSVDAAVPLADGGAGDAGLPDVAPHAPDAASDAVSPDDVLAVPDLARDEDAPSGDALTEDAGPPPTPLTPFEAADPMIGTGVDVFNVGNAFPGACTPFGMVKVSPDTTGYAGAAVPFHCAGYSYNDPLILGFSHMHLHGTGAPGYGVLRVVPTVGMSDEKTSADGYRSHYDHETEEASPGYYAVTLTDPEVRVELTAGPRTALHRFTYPAGSQGVVIFDLSEILVGGEVTDAEVTIDPARNAVTGWQHANGGFQGRYGGFVVYFEAVFARPFAEHGVWSGGARRQGEDHATGNDIGAWFSFHTHEDPSLEMQIGISLVEPASARANRETELGGRGFDETRAAAAAAWEAELERIEIAGASEKERVIFYTALYHSMMMPTLLTDVDGRYMGFDREAHVAEDFLYYTDFSMWDTFRTLHPLLTLIVPDRAADMAQSLTRMAEQGGAMPRWPMGIGYTGSMIGSSADCVIADAYVKGATGFDVESAYGAVRMTATGPRPPGTGGGRDNIEDYLRYGYVPAPLDGSVSKTLEYAFEDYCLAQLATELGETADAEMFLAHSQYYRNLWHAEDQFFRPRDAEGNWIAKDIFQSYGIGDTFTPDITQYALARALRVDQVTNNNEPLDNIDVENPPVNGNALFNLIRTTAIVAVYQPNADEDGHYVTFDQAGARRQYSHFLATAVRDGIPTVVAP